MIIKHKISQAIVEYAVLIIVVVFALAVMQIYLKRSYQGRIKREADSLGTQYAPGQTASKTVTDMSSYAITYTGGVTSTGDNTPEYNLVSQDGHEIEPGTSVTVSATRTTTQSAERVGSLRP